MYSLCAVVCALIAATAATEVRQCPGQSFEGLSDAVQLMPCKKLPCRLKKGTDQHITIKFTPDQDLKDIRNRMSADVLGVLLPFVGVDGTSVCDKLKTESGEKASCPLTAGTTYIYKDSFPVLPFYPSINVDIHWALETEKKHKIICFLVPVRIL